MPLRRWDCVPYLPILSLRPAELRALEELPNLTKDHLLPIIPLRPWVGSLRLENSLRRIEEAYGNRPIVIAMGEREPPTGRPVSDELDALRREHGGFDPWCSFIADHPNFIPAIQFGQSQADESAQIGKLASFGRGLVVIIGAPAFAAAESIAARVAERTEEGVDVCFLLDFGAADRDHHMRIGHAEHMISAVRRAAPQAFVALSASSFPDAFSGLVEQPIYERLAFNSVTGRFGLIYSDRGSARFESLSGGSGQPAPRIDYPVRDRWMFYRSDDLVGFAGYQQQAIRLMRSSIWEPNFRVWGTQMIERTAAGDTSAIGGAQKATAARINLHLQRQAFYDDPAAAGDTDEDWEG